MKGFDAVVVGAGPSGATAGRDLARAGARVALVDGSHPREKPCGGGVTGRALALAGLESDAAHTVDSAVFETAVRRAAVPLPDPGCLRIVSRDRFDCALVEQAIEAGATLVPARVTAITRGGGRWTVAAGEHTLDAGWLLGADGASGFVRKQVFRPFERAQLSIAAGCFVDGVDAREVVVRFVDRPQGYLWSFPRRGHLAVGACAQADETTSAEMHAITDRWLDGYAPAAGHPRRRYAWPIPSLDAAALHREVPAGDGWMLLGDAAGLVDPITREGIYFAIRSGMLAAAALRKADPSRAYNEAVRGELHDELRRAARFKAGFFRPRFTRLMVEALTESAAIRAVMIDLIAGRQPYAGLKRRLLGTLEVGLMLRAFAVTSPGSRRGRGR
jgi:geranylgeranyl reductase family protein